MRPKGASKYGEHQGQQPDGDKEYEYLIPKEYDGTRHFLNTDAIGRIEEDYEGDEHQTLGEGE